MILTIRISGYLNIRIRIFWIFDPYTAISKARKLKLGMDDHLKGTNALGYPDIRISASASAVPCVVANLEMIINDLCKLKLGMDDHLKGANVLGYLDIRISASSSAVPCVVANLEMIIMTFSS